MTIGSTLLLAFTICPESRYTYLVQRIGIVIYLYVQSLRKVLEIFSFELQTHVRSNKHLVNRMLKCHKLRELTRGVDRLSG